MYLFILYVGIFKYWSLVLWITALCRITFFFLFLPISQLRDVQQTANSIYAEVPVQPLAPTLMVWPHAIWVVCRPAPVKRALCWAETSASVFPNVAVPTMAVTFQLGSPFGLTKNASGGANACQEPEKYNAGIKAVRLAVSAWWLTESESAIQSLTAHVEPQGTLIICHLTERSLTSKVPVYTSWLDSVAITKTWFHSKYWYRMTPGDAGGFPLLN